MKNHRTLGAIAAGCLPIALLLNTVLATAAPTLVVQKLQFWSAAQNTRIVMDLNTRPQDLTVVDVPGKPMTVSFKGTLKGVHKPFNKTFSLPNLRGVFVDNRHGKVQLFIKRNYVGSVAVRSSDDRLVVDIPNTRPAPSSKTENITSLPPGAASAKVAEKLAIPLTDPEVPPEGVRHYSFSQRTGAGASRVNVLEIDPKHPGIEISPALAGKRMGAKANVASMVASNQAVGGINGSFFKQDKGIPLGILIINQELISGPIYDRVALGITPTNDLVMQRVTLAGEVALPDGQKIRLHNINQPRVSKGQTVVYTSRWGQNAPAVPSNGLQIQLHGNRVTAVSGSAPLPIPRDGVVISGPATPEMIALAGNRYTRPIQLNVYTLPDWSGMKHAIGGGPFLVKNGRQFVDMKMQHFSSKALGFREPRSAVGITPDGKMLLVTVDGRQKNGSSGMTLNEMAYLMQKLGCVNAMNLDGGSSTQMAFKGRTINSPSAGNIGVSNSLIVRQTTDDNVAWQDR